jgi:uncharacterized 2Fe-2S/4Fe-4S cluster protein (DUF4445 family)
VPEFTLLLRGLPHTLDCAAPGSKMNLLQAVYLSGLLEPPSLCAGLGLCGRCRVRFLPGTPLPSPQPEELDILGEEALEQGWRLACRHYPEPGSRLELPPEVAPLPPGRKKAGSDSTAAAAGHLALAVDFGTTSLHFSSVPPEESWNSPTAKPEQPGSRIRVNPQMGAGAEVISRLAFALHPRGLARLGELSRAALARMVEETEAEAGGGRNVAEICLAANSAMTCLILGKDVHGLAHAPYRLDYAGGCRENLPGLPPLWVAPLASPFIGGDITAGYAALALGAGEPFPFLLADLGTNGEFILALSPDTALGASLPLGPALEGAGLRCGSGVGPGVITDFTLSPRGLTPKIPGPAGAGPPGGISGSGYISLIRHLLQSGILRPDGRFASGGEILSPLAGRLAGLLVRNKGGSLWRLSESSPLYLAASDVEEVLKIKAAFSLVLKSLLKAASLRFTDLRALHLAGTLGAHVRSGDLEVLGFIPPGGGSKVKAAGNTSLAGSALLCRRPALRPELIRWSGRLNTLNLPEQENFQSLYAEEMRFSPD